MSTLRETQHLLWRLITAPEGVEPALRAADARGEPLRAALQRTVRGDERLDAVERLDIYANMYFFRLLDVLKDDYAATAALLGEAAFHNLVTDYLLRHFPSHPSLRYAGRQLADFVAAHALSRQHPWAADLARLEWAIVDAFDAPDQPQLDAAQLRAVPEQEWSDLHLRLNESVQILECGWSVHLTRREFDEQRPLPVPERMDCAICVWRSEERVYHRPLAADEALALQMIQRGGTFGEACAAAAAALSEEEAPQRLASLLSGWLSAGLFHALA